MDTPERSSDARTRFADSLRITREELHKFLAACDSREANIIIELLKAKKHRSSFRASLDAQVRAWLATDSLKPKPLSPAQFDAAEPKWPVNNVIPADVQ